MKKVILYKDRIQKVGGLIFVIVFAIVGVRLLLQGHALLPSTPTIQVCGERQASDVEKYTGPTLPKVAYVNEITPAGSSGISYYRYWPGTQITGPEWYIAQVSKSQMSFFVYDASTNALVTNFNITAPSNGTFTNNSFAVDPLNGNVDVADAISGNSGVISQWTTTGNEVWATAMSNVPSGAIYGYYDSNNTYRIGVVVASGSVKEAFSNTYNAAGASMGSNLVVGDDVQIATADSNKIVSTQYATNNIIIYNSTATNQTFYMSAGPYNASSPLGGPAGANLLSDGTIVMTSSSKRLMVFFSPTGNLLGSIGADLGAGQPLDVINQISPVTIVNGRIYYNAESPFSVPNKLTYLTVANAQLLYQAPQKAPFHLGLGANLQTGAKDNYFASGIAPTVNVQFNQWWQSQAATYTGKYTVRNIQQIIANQSGTSGTFSIPASASSYFNGAATVGLNLPAAAPGVYEVDTQLVEFGSVVGADCVVYTVGATNSSFDPNSIPSGGDTSGVYLAHQFGQRLFRSTYNIDQCFPGVTTPTSTTTLNCPASMDSDVASAASLAAQLGVTYELQLGVGNAFDKNAVASGQWQRLVGLIVAHYPAISNWECWNEPDNNSFSSASTYVTTGLAPCYTAIKSVSASDKVLGISNENITLGNYQNYVNAGALKYLDIVAVHAYTGWNKSFEEQGQIIPTAYNSAETGQLQALQQYLASQNYSGPLYDTESGFWNNSAGAPYDYYKQGDKLVRKMILENSIGMNWYSNFFNTGGYQVGGTYWELLGGSKNALNPGGLAAITYQDNLGGRTFKSWLATGIPHTYAAEYGPSSSSNNNVVAIWSDDYTVNVSPALNGNGNMTVTSEYGDVSTLISGTSLPINGSVQYITVPVGQTLSLTSPEGYGINYALTAQGASASASSSFPCSTGTADPNTVLAGIIDAEGSNFICHGRNGTVWSATQTDTNPTLTISLKSPQTLDRIFISSFSLGSILTNLRNYQVQVDNGSGNFTTAANVTNQFYNRNNLISFNPQTVSQIRITGIEINYTGYGDGLPPTFWSSSFNNLTAIYDVEAYKPNLANASFETESGKVINSASIKSDSSASGGKYVQFGP